MNNEFCHIELNTCDQAGAKEFYSKMFNWKFEKYEMPGGAEYSMFNPGKGPAGGIMQNPEKEHPTTWLVYINVASVEESVKKAVELGAQVIMDKTPVPDMGYFAALLDPQGAAFAIWEELKKG